MTFWSAACHFLLQSYIIALISNSKIGYDRLLAGTCTKTCHLHYKKTLYLISYIFQLSRITSTWVTNETTEDTPRLCKYHNEPAGAWRDFTILTDVSHSRNLPFSESVIRNGRKIYKSSGIDWLQFAASTFLKTIIEISRYTPKYLIDWKRT